MIKWVIYGIAIATWIAMGVANESRDQSERGTYGYRPAR